ncbi:hypothetical protein [Streptomyces sp. NPDC002690]
MGIALIGAPRGERPGVLRAGVGPAAADGAGAALADGGGAGAAEGWEVGAGFTDAAGVDAARWTPRAREETAG